MDKIELNATVIGGGIVGLLTALELKKKYPQWEIALLEASPFIGDQSTGRNSGVLHAGLYYPKNSLKHLLCLEGINLWKKDLCPEYKIDYLECGKVLFAKNQDEVSGLEALWNKAKDNGVTGLSLVAEHQLKEVNKYVYASTAFFSSETGILDVTGAIKKISQAFLDLGGMIAKECLAIQIQKKNNSFLIITSELEITSDLVINAAGLQGPELRKTLSLMELESVWVKGNYLSTSQKLQHSHLFYPVPPKDLKGLGVHSTLDLDGKIKFGPNTEDITIIDYSDTQGSLKIMSPEIINTFRGLDESRLYWDYAGIRSKIKNINTGMLEVDFWIKSPIPGYIECLGIESPGLTSAPAIAKKIICDFIL